MNESVEQKLDLILQGKVLESEVYFFWEAFCVWIVGKMGTEEWQYAQICKHEFFKACKIHYKAFYMDKLYKLDYSNATDQDFED